MICLLIHYAKKAIFNPLTAMFLLLRQIDALTDKKYTFNELSKMVRNTASGLVKIGLKPGDIVTIKSPNCLEYPIVYLAIQEIGAIASPVNPLYTAGTRV